MTLQQLRYVAEIAVTGSLSRAAERMYVAQPSLSASIRELENEIGVKLFNRGNRGVSLTNEGSTFLPYALSVLEQVGRLEDAYGGSARKPKFGVSTQHYSFAVKAFVEMVRAFDVSQYEFALRETRTRDVIDDVAALRSEIGILYLSEFNRKAILKLLGSRDLSFTCLITCNAFVYLWKGHPLAHKESISFDELKPYPNLSFEQGEAGSFYYAEEILSTNEYPRTIKCNDRATMLNLMVGVNGYTLCSGIICEELNGSDYMAVPYLADPDNRNSLMEIGYIFRKNHLFTEAALRYIEELKRYLNIQA